MSDPTPGSDPQYPQGAQGQPGYGAPQQQPGYGAPQQQPGYGYPPPGYGPAPTYAGGQGAVPSLAFPDAVKSVLNQYANFSGRARRSEYWWFVLFYALVYVVAAIIDGILGVPILTLIVALGLLVPALAVSVRRLHDTDRSGWWLLLNLVPFGGIVVLVFSCLDSQPGPNRFGPSPKHQAPAGY